MLCGLLFPTTGTIRIGGFDLQKEGDRARQLISYVPDQPYLYEKLTGREFLQFIADELSPYIEKNYRARETGRVLAGHSFGGLFALYALFAGGAAHRLARNV